ncbi:unnamed protein product [Caenorhabditis sp. 36 PRJEB53466]|nr:unnamed protein product [Caenorhabditis sp. 36 PRJEB53466]
MDLIKKKFDKKKKKATTKKGQQKAAKNPAQKKASKDKKKKKKANKKKQSDSSSDSSDNSDDSQRVRLKAVQSKLAVDAANIDKKYRMTGSLIKKPENPEGFARKVLEAEWKEMVIDPKVPLETVRTLDVYLKNRAELKSTDHVVIAEKVDDDEKKATTRLKVLTKFDEGRFAGIYMVQNEAAVNNDVVSISNGRFMMKTALRQLSSHQITYRLSREINILKSFWSKKEDAPQRLPPILYDGRILGVPFYVTNIYDINLEKCREEMGGGNFCSKSMFLIAQEVMLAIKFLHRHQLVHRDIKPHNIVLSLQNRDQWFLIDFGDTVGVSRTSSLSPPDGQTLPFVSREGHDQLLASAPTTYQQDLDSWFLTIIDMYKSLPWRDNPKIDQVAKEKKEFFKNPVPFLSDLPPQMSEIFKLLKTDAAPYTAISRKISEGLSDPKESGGAPEWYDRQATRKMAKQQRKKKNDDDTTTTTTTTLEGEEQAAPTRKDRSVYLAATEGPRPTRKVSREAAELTANKVASIVDDGPNAPTPPSPNQRQDRSVYLNDFPAAAAAIDANKKKYRFKPKAK